MKRKELKNIANEIVKSEMILQQSSSSEEQKSQAQEAIMSLSRRINNINDFFVLDDMIQTLLQNKK